MTFADSCQTIAKAIRYAHPPPPLPRPSLACPAEVEPALRDLAERLRIAELRIVVFGYFGSCVRGNWGVGSDVDLIAIIGSPAMPGHLTGDRSVGVADLLILLSSWGECPEPEFLYTDWMSCPADLTGDCNVGVGDLLLLLANWG